MSKDTDQLFDDEITTGATLESGTTVGGNTVYHLGNDGQGSGLDAKSIDGSVPVLKGPKYSREKVNLNSNTGSVISQFSSPSERPVGLGVDLSDCIWNGSEKYENESIYQVDQSGNIQTGFASPCTTLHGLGVSSNDCIWHSDGTDIFRMNHTGTVVYSFAAGDPNAVRGIGLDSGDSIWFSNRDTKSIYQVDHSGNIQSKFKAPSLRVSGVGVDSTDSVWHSQRLIQSIYQLNQSGGVITKFTAPGSDAGGIATDSNDTVWYTDVNSDSIYEIGGTNYKTKLQKL